MGVKIKESKENSTTIRITRTLYKHIKDLSVRFNENMQDIIEDAVAQYEKQRFFEELTASYERLKSDESEWKEEIAERNLLDSTLNDVLDEDEINWDELYSEEKEIIT